MPVATGDYSLSVRRWNTNSGSMFPDMFVDCKKSTDGGTTWTQVQQDSKPAMWNIMINAVEAEAGKPVPQLMYGRYNGKNVYIPGSGSCDIPEGGIYLELSDHSSPDSEFGYHVWIRNNSGTLELSATTDDVARTDGINHKSGDTSYRYLGKVYPEAIHTGHYGPVDCFDIKSVANKFNKVKKVFGKRNPYSASTYEFVPLYNVWFSWNDNGDDYLAKILLDESQDIMFSWNAQTGTARVGSVAIGIDKKIPEIQGRGSGRLYDSGEGSTFNQSQKVGRGFHQIWPLCKSYGGAELIMYYYHAVEPSYTPIEWFGIAEF